MIKHVVSVSGGKDSAATLLLALQHFGKDAVVPIFSDTGNEHDEVVSYLDYLETRLGITILRLMADFTEQIMAKRMFIARDSRVGRKHKRVPKKDKAGNPIYLRNKDGSYVLVPVYAQDENGNPTTEVISMAPVPKMGWDAGIKIRWTNKAKRRALAVLYPTGNPFLDLCLWKGRFPSRRAQFCTQELKVNIAVAFQLDLIDAGHQVVSWQGVRRDESANRRNAKRFERIGPSLIAFRPLVDWSAADVFEYCSSQGIKPNPLYLQGMDRVGCMPCINVNKGELKEISRRFPEHIARVAEWEKLVAQASKRQAATFIPAPGIQTHEASQHDIYSVVQWAKTSRGGKQFDLLEALETSGCSSSYGLCDQPGKIAA